MTFRFVAVGVLLAAVLAPAGVAAAASGITPLTPRAGAVVPKGKSTTFTLRVHGSGRIWVRVCSSPKKSRDGVICDNATLGEAIRGKGGVASYRPRFFDFPQFWLNRPGTYYWQAYRLQCVHGDCRQEGPVVRFRVG
jgi:hypothetical protein